MSKRESEEKDRKRCRCSDVKFMLELVRKRCHREESEDLERFGR